MDATGIPPLLAYQVHTVQIVFFLANFSAYICCLVLDAFMYALCVNYSVGLVLIPRGVFVNECCLCLIYKNSKRNSTRNSGSSKVRIDLLIEDEASI